MLKCYLSYFFVLVVCLIILILYEFTLVKDKVICIKVTLSCLDRRKGFFLI